MISSEIGMYCRPGAITGRLFNGLLSRIYVEDTSHKGRKDREAKGGKSDSATNRSLTVW
jgi:hypothetical protein